MTRKTKPDPATDGRKASHAEEWAFQWQQGLMSVGRFIDAVERGDDPAHEDARLLAAALRELLCHRDADVSLRAFADRLGMDRRQGKRPQTAGEDARAHGAAVMVALRARELVAAGSSPTRARTQAMHEAAKRDGVAVRTVQSWCKVHAESANWYVAMATKTRNENTG